MPSGFTSDIYKGKDVTLRDYLMQVARGMGFAIMQRDDKWNEPVKRVEPSTSYYDEQIEKGQKRLAEITQLTPEEREAAAQAAFEKQHAAWVERQEKDAKLRERYQAMLAEVNAWKPDPLLQSMKEHAIKYLLDSMEFDCPDDRRWRENEPQPKSGEAWFAEEVASATRDIEYGREHKQEEIERAAERNRYIDALYASLPE